VGGGGGAGSAGGVGARSPAAACAAAISWFCAGWSRAKPGLMTDRFFFFFASSADAELAAYKATGRVYI